MLARLTVVALLCTAAFAQDEKKQEEPKPRAKMDAAVDDFKLKDVMKDEETFVTLSEYKDKKIVVLYYVSDKCPVTWAYERRTGKLMEDFRKQDVVWLGIRSSAADTAEQIRKYAESKNYDIPVLYDDRNVVADYYNVRVTPTYVVIDKKGAMRYRGACDDLQTGKNFNAKDATPKSEYLRDALNAVLEGKDVPVKETKGYG
jgi:peroxiredoxin